MELAQLDELIARHSGHRPTLVGLLQDVQEADGYIARYALERISEKLNVPLIQLYGLVTFYRSLSLEPRGRHTVSVCLGTTCHVRGGARLLRAMETELGTQCNSTTENQRFTLQDVRCLGACSIAPIVAIDKDTYGRVRQGQLPRLLRKYA